MSKLFKIWDVQGLTAVWLAGKPFSRCRDAAMRGGIDALITAYGDQSRLLRNEGFESKVFDRELVERADDVAYCAKMPSIG
jgi:hypothetical protein